LELPYQGDAKGTMLRNYDEHVKPNISMLFSTQFLRSSLKLSGEWVSTFGLEKWLGVVFKELKCYDLLFEEKTQTRGEGGAWTDD
jgi:hypothetical protein